MVQHSIAHRLQTESDIEALVRTPPAGYLNEPDHFLATILNKGIKRNFLAGHFNGPLANHTR